VQESFTTEDDSKGEMTMRTMSKSAAAVRFDRGEMAQSAPRGTAAARSGGTAATSRPANTLADRLKTFLDRTLDAARGRYDM
jgi:hypothetical protein